MTIGPLGSPPGAELPGEPGPPGGAEEPWWLPDVDREPTDAELHGAGPDPFAGPPDARSWLERQAEADSDNGDDQETAGGGPTWAFAEGGPAGAITPGPVL